VSGHPATDGNPYAAPVAGDAPSSLDAAMAVYDRHPRLARVVADNFAVYAELWRLRRDPPGWPRPWNWAAFLFDFKWLLYRRMYGMAVAYVLISMVGGAAIVLAGMDDAAIWGLTLALKIAVSLAANALYLRRCRAVIARAEAAGAGDGARVEAYIDRRSGVSRLALGLGIVFSVALQALDLFGGA
jgi:hypothetical protein